MLTLVVVGVGLALSENRETTTLQVQGSQTIETIGMTSQLKGNTNKTLGPIPALQGSWFGVNTGANRSIALSIGSNLTGTIFTANGTEFDTVVLLRTSANYFVTASNPKGATASLTGNVTLVILATANSQYVKTTRTHLVPGAALSIIGGITALYLVLPGSPSRRRSYDRLFP